MKEYATILADQFPDIEPLERPSTLRRESFITEFAKSKGPPQIVMLVILLALGFGSTIGVVSLNFLHREVLALKKRREPILIAYRFLLSIFAGACSHDRSIRPIKLWLYKQPRLQCLRHGRKTARMPQWICRCPEWRCHGADGFKYSNLLYQLIGWITER